MKNPEKINQGDSSTSNLQQRQAIAETKELKSIVSYSSKSFESCRMVEICNYLGDEMSSNCDKCDNCIDRKFINHFSICDNQILSMIEDFKDNYYPTIEFKSKN